MKLAFTVLALFQIFSYSSFSQADTSGKYKEYFDDGEYFFHREDYEEAVFYYLKLLEYQPDNANYNFKIGECYLNIPGREALAVPYFEKAVTNITEKNKYKKRSFEEDKAPLHAWFYLGNAYRIANMLNKALKAYDTFVRSPLYAGNYNSTIVENEIKSCERAKIIEDNPVEIEQTLLPDIINTSASELRPVISGDEKTLVFVRTLKFYNAIFLVRLKDGTWSDPVNLNPEIGSDGDFYPTSLSFSGDELYLVRDNGGNKDIYLSRLVDGKWTKAVSLGNKINSLSDESHAAITEKGNKLYIASDRKGGRGGVDIWLSAKDKTGQWGKPKNLGKVVNTSFDEAAPYPIKNGNVLFFSSKGHFNMGGFDIFYAVLSNRKWGTPVNIGSPVNDTGDNTNYMPTPDGHSGYLSRYPEPGAPADIFKITILSNLPEF